MAAKLTVSPALNLFRFLFGLAYFVLVLQAKIETRNKFQNTVYAQNNIRSHPEQVTAFNDGGSVRPSWSAFQRRLETARLNTGTANKFSDRKVMSLDERHFVLPSDKLHKDGDTTPIGPFDPTAPAQPFTLDTLNGPLKFPSEILPNNSNVPIIFHTFNNHSGFLETLWTDGPSLRHLVTDSPDNTRYVFMSTGEDAYSDALWMRGQIKSAMWELMDIGEIKPSHMNDLVSHMHFVTTPVYELGNWIPTLLNHWACEDHGCGLPQAKFTNDTSTASGQPIILKRLDAHYDWLPSPSSVFQDQSIQVVLSEDGCSKDASVANTIAMVIDGNCDFYDKMGFMQRSKALGVIVYAKSGQPVQDMNCVSEECDQEPPSIPGTMIPYNRDLLAMLQEGGSVNVTFQTTSTSNFYFAIDGQGLLAEMGWLLYPSFQFFAWQAQWFNYKSMLQQNLSEKAFVLPVVNSSIMQGETGIVKTVKLPKLTEILKYQKVELDASLSCPGTRDDTCPPWDHIMSLYVCCDKTSVLCGMEIGRWITPFRRRIGRWLTDITPLIPLFTSDTCTFTMKLDAFWAEPWKPSLNIRFSDYNKKPGNKDSQPYQIIPLFQGGTFNKSYNAQYKPINFTIPDGTTKVEIVSVITGHGSDENGCGEFCVTSHHFVVNDYVNNRTFSKAGTLEGCADGTPITGVEPNEHGTWLYGRNGWCNGREVDPWVIDITSQVSLEGSVNNSVNYFGWFQGGDPDPKSEPGYIVMYSYLVYYRSFT